MSEEKNCYVENSFFQSAKNAEKLGAYYTDIGHCRRIGHLFDFDTAEEICVLEPSIGDGSAVLAVTGGRDNCKIFGVEIQQGTYEKFLKDNDKFMYILHEDFLKGVKISRGAFSFCFANPPYGVSREGEVSKRLEALFLEKITGYLQADSYLVYVIPFAVFSEEKFFRQVMTRYEICSYYRFDEEEFQKFHQIVVILKKKKGTLCGYSRTDFEREYVQAASLENYPFLPSLDDQVEPYPVKTSKDSSVEFFMSMAFDPQEAYPYLGQSELFSIIGEQIFQKPYTGFDLNQPIVPVSKDISYLLATTGGGQGFAGNESEGTLHLQRGVARREESEEIHTNAENDPSSMTVTSYTKIHLNIIENSGRITTL